MPLVFDSRQLGAGRVQPAPNRRCGLLDAVGAPLRPLPAGRRACLVRILRPGVGRFAAGQRKEHVPVTPEGDANVVVRGGRVHDRFEIGRQSGGVQGVEVARFVVAQLQLCGEPALDRAIAPAEEGVAGGPLARRTKGDVEAVECSGNERYENRY